MNWENFGGGVASITIAYLIYRAIQRRKRKSGENAFEGLTSVLNIQFWGTMILFFILGVWYIVKSFL
jgi:hypothetical protein